MWSNQPGSSVGVATTNVIEVARVNVEVEPPDCRTETLI
jgi:hypothetical protein